MRGLSFFLLLALCVGGVRAQAFALEQLENSPRHHEWVEVPAGTRSVHSFVAYPEAETPTGAVLVIHENRGLTDWVRAFADQIAEAGYLAIAPDLLSGFDEQHDRTADFAHSDSARSALYDLDPDQITRDLRAVKAYIAQNPASNGRVAVIGFCWGGSQAFRFATDAQDLAAVFVFYGRAPEEPSAFAGITAPVFGFYGQNDARINATLPETERQMLRNGKAYDQVIYDGAGHAFMRRGDDPDGSPEDKKARDEAWTDLRALLAAINK